MNDVKELIEQNDKVLTEHEEKLIKAINVAYQKALKACTKEFKELEGLDPGVKLGSQQVKEILAKAMTNFQDEYQVLIKPIREAMLKCYDEGLKEAGQFLESLENKM
jgi:hypothetical protein